MALRFDQPWEGLWAGCISVLHDPVTQRYFMYYRGLPILEDDHHAHENTCVATSDDGIHWTKPMLDRHPAYGAQRNNIIIYGVRGASHNFSPFYDTRPGVPEAERFKAIAGTHPQGLFGYVSADGFDWRPISSEPLLTSEAFAFDSQNVAFWSEHEQRYVCYFRTWRSLDSHKGLGVRWISRSTSEDFAHWSAFEQMDAGDTPPEHLYTQQTHPYFRAPHIYISLAARFMPGRQAITEEQVKALGVAPGYEKDCSDTVLMTSRGGARYDRTFMESFLRPGPGAANWISRTNYAGLGIIPTAMGQMSLFAHRHYAQPTAHAGRFTLRTDGFASVHASYAGGEMRTHPLVFTGGELVLNVATSAAGGVRIELQDAAGKPIEGYALRDAVEIVGDDIERVVRWTRGSDVSALAGQAVRVRMVLSDADVYAMRFR